MSNVRFQIAISRSESKSDHQSVYRSASQLVS